MFRGGIGDVEVGEESIVRQPEGDDERRRWGHAGASSARCWRLSSCVRRSRRQMLRSPMLARLSAAVHFQPNSRPSRRQTCRHTPPFFLSLFDPSLSLLPALPLRLAPSPLRLFPPPSASPPPDPLRVRRYHAGFNRPPVVASLSTLITCCPPCSSKKVCPLPPSSALYSRCLNRVVKAAAAAAAAADDGRDHAEKRSYFSGVC